MGANAQTAVPVFTAGQVLTAQQQTQINTGIPVFATTVTRDAAFGGAGEKTLAEGQFAFLEDTNTTQFYDGAAWQSVGATPGLVFLTGASFTTATNFSLPTNTFSSTYTNYKIFVQLTAVTADSDFTMRMRASGTDNTTSSYRTAGVGILSTGVAANVVGDAQTSFNMGESDPALAWYSVVFDILSPQAANNTIFHGSLTALNKASSGQMGVHMTGTFTVTTSFDSLTFISSTASSITGFYKVYGYANS